jgi:hypothetical protein
MYKRLEDAGMYKRLEDAGMYKRLEDAGMYKRFSSSPNRSDILWGPIRLLFNGQHF